jgi:hypothetical protein
MEDVGLFYVHLVYFMDIWHILRSYGIFYGHLVFLSVLVSVGIRQIRHVRSIGRFIQKWPWGKKKTTNWLGISKVSCNCHNLVLWRHSIFHHLPFLPNFFVRPNPDYKIPAPAWSTWFPTHSAQFLMYDVSQSTSDFSFNDEQTKNFFPEKTKIKARRSTRDTSGCP